MSLIDWLTIQKTFLVDTLSFWWCHVRFNASSHTEADREKWEYVLLRETHTIEKGLSLHNPRKGFGQQKVKELMAHLAAYQHRYGADNPDFLRYPLLTICYWMDYTKANGVEIPALEQQFEALARQSGVETLPHERVTEQAEVFAEAGVREITREEVQQAAREDFRSLLHSRHSVRYFMAEPVGHATIDEALRMAQQTPSACNRQGWKTHVFEGNACHEMLKWQGGSRGFEEDVHQAILVTASQKAFLYYEMHQAYVDGGLYAMNLINALHALGLGTIPLSCGFKERKLRRLRRQFDIPSEELPIVIIGFGQLPDRFKVAVSERKDIALTNRYHANR